MKKRFVGKRTKKKKISSILFFFALVLFFFFFSFHLSVEFLKDHLKQEQVLEIMMQNSFGRGEFYDFLMMNPTEYLFSSTMGLRIPKSESKYYEEEETGPVYEYVPDPNPTQESSEPFIYIYNTHQTEGYSKVGISEYDIVPTVLFASYFLREKLNDYSLSTLVESSDISEVLRVNGWNYGASYQASRYLMLDAKEKHPTIQYFLDIHRDSAGYENTTTEFNGKKYAKILFVIGKEHQNFEKNLEFANQINERLKGKVGTISRGVIGKEGKNVNGIYNQDVHPNTLLLEIGGKDNTIVEVTNTMEILASVIKEYIEEMNG